MAFGGQAYDAFAADGVAGHRQGTGTLEVRIDVTGLGGGGASPPAGMTQPHNPGVAGWKVNVLTEHGALVTTLVTDANGRARAELEPGRYRVVLPGDGVRPRQCVRVAVTIGKAISATIHVVNPLP